MLKSYNIYDATSSCIIEKMDLPLITVIMPVYQAENTIYRAVDSILSQTFTKYDLILVDDGSVDNSGTICDEYAAKDRRILVIHKANGGANSARNAALDIVSTDYVTFCDSDDYVDNNWLADFLNNTEDVDVVIAGIKRIYEDRIDILNFHPLVCDAPKSADMMSGKESFGYLPCKCFRTSIIHAHHLRFNENFRFLEDEEFICRYWQYIKKVRFVDSCAYNYFVPAFSTKYSNIDGYQLYKNLLGSASAFIPVNADSVTLRKYTMGCFRSMMYAYQHHEYAEAWCRLKVFAKNSEKFQRHNKYMRVIRRWNYILWHPFLICYTLVKG